MLGLTAQRRASSSMLSAAQRMHPSTRMNSTLKRIGSFFGMNFDGKTTMGSARALFFNCKNQADNPFWYSRGRIGKDFRGRHTMLMTHIWMVHKRLIAEDMGTQGKQIQECLFDELWEDTSNRIRGVGINELSVNKYLKEVQGYSFKYVIELDQAVSLLKKAATDKPTGDSLVPIPTSEDDKLLLVKDEIAGALWRSAFMRRDEIEVEHVLEMADYVYNEHRSMMGISQEAVLEGRIKWGVLPNWKQVRKVKSNGNNPSISSSSSSSGVVGSTETADEGSDEEDGTNTASNNRSSSSSSSSGAENGKGEWKEAMSASGTLYYWNTKTRETSWIKPK